MRIIFCQCDGGISFLFVSFPLRTALHASLVQQLACICIQLLETARLPVSELSEVSLVATGRER